MGTHTKTAGSSHHINNMIMLLFNVLLFAYSIWQYVLSRGTGNEGTWIALMAFNLAWLFWNMWQYKHHLALE